VKLTGDNVLVLLHDDTVDRTTDGQGLAKDMTRVQLQALDAGSWRDPRYAGERIPTFEETARLTQSLQLLSNVEIKPCPGRDHETGAAVALAARALWKDAAVKPLLSSFSEEALTAAHVAAPELPRALLVEQVPVDWHEKMVRHDCVALNVNQKNVTQDLIEAVHERGYRIAAYTVNDPQRARELLQWGIDGLFTDELASIAPSRLDTPPIQR